MKKVHERWRITHGPLATTSDSGVLGAYSIPAPVMRGRELLVIASDGSDWIDAGLTGLVWEHVSVHAAAGPLALTPTWSEMAYIKGLFWEEEACVIQFHPPKSVYQNVHPHTLHLWRPLDFELPMPPLSTI
jgi:hypothetical protein